MVERSSGPGWSLTIENGRLMMALKKAPDELNRRLRYALRDAANDIETRVIRGMVGFTPGKRGPSDPLMHRTGKLAQSVDGFVTGTTIRDLQGIIKAGGRDVPYARIQEYGGTIYPKKKYLRVPLPEVLTPAGAVKGNYELFERARGDWRTGDGRPTWISGRAIMVLDKGKPMPIWALITKSVIPPRLGIGKTIEERSPATQALLRDAIEGALKPRGTQP